LKGILFIVGKKETLDFVISYKIELFKLKILSMDITELIYLLIEIIFIFLAIDYFINAYKLYKLL
jgi:hypothetical protein